MTGVNLVLGDCLEKMKEIPDGSVNMILCDLPYGTTRCAWDVIIPFEPLWEQYRRVTKDNAAIVLTAAAPFDKILAASNLREFRHEWIWHKTEATGHLNAKRAPMKAHETVLVFYKKLPVYNPQKTQGHTRKVATKDHTKRLTEVYGHQSGTYNYDSTERYPRSVITFSTGKQKGRLHPSQKPVELFEYMIRTYTNEGATVLDNCMGSGTTGVSCINTNRNFIGIEKEEKYFNIAVERINKAKELKNG